MKPDFLFHYTSLESLALILSSRKLKFNSLNQFDDLAEGKCKDYRSIGSYFFVSCWTDLEQESIPFWNMYTPQMKGIRIKLPSDLFNENIIITDGVSGLKPGIFKSIVPQEETFNLKYWVVPTQNEYLFEVKYTEDEELLFPKIRETIGDEFKIHLNKIGQFKSGHWSFQSEWRYILKILPNISKLPIGYNKPHSDLLSDSLFSMQKGDKLPFSEYYVSIRDNSFAKMEVLLGPKHSMADRVILESLISKYNSTANIAISELYKKIR